MALNPSANFDPSTARLVDEGAGGFDPTSAVLAPDGPKRTFTGALRDVGVAALKSAVAVPQSAVGLLDIPTGGRIGKGLESVGLRFKDAQDILADQYSDAQKARQREVDQADGFVDTAKAMLANPSTIATAAGESLAPMFAGGAGARLLGLAKRFGPVAAGAIGEGMVGAGSAASQIREQTDDGLLTPRQAALAGLSGVGTAALGLAGGKVAQRLGIGDIDTMVAQGAAKTAGTPSKSGFIGQVAKGAVAEGAFEELPQSLQEQTLQNLALDKPFDDGMGKAAAQGLIVGGAMGAAGGAIGARANRLEQLAEQAAMERATSAAADADARSEAIYPNVWAAGQQAFEAAPPVDAVAPEAPEYTTSAGAAQANDPGGVDFQRQVDTSGLSLIDPEQQAREEAERARSTIDFEAQDTTPSWSTAAGARGERQGLDVPPREIDTGSLGFEQPTRRLGYSPLAGQPVIFADGTVALSSEAAEMARASGMRPSQALGIDAAAGTLSAVAADAIDSGATTAAGQKALAAKSAGQPTAHIPLANGGRFSFTQGDDGLLRNARGEPFTKLQAGIAARQQGNGFSFVEVDGGFAVVPPDQSAAPVSRNAAQPQGAPVVEALPAQAVGNTSVRLQNRNRSSAASVAQMNSIASAPDYLRAGQSRTMDQGAPVVFGDLPASAVVGREETVVDGRGDRVKARYAVVEAGDVLTSHQADGTPIAAYEQGQSGKVRAVAGNGRAAGLAEAYRRGSSGNYRTELEQDAQSLGVDPGAVRAMRNPVLVRMMEQGDVTPDIGDRSNTVGTQRLSPVEQAANDADRVDLSALRFTDDGRPQPASINGFVQAMPEAERGDMLNPDGTPTRQATDRLMAAAFKQAYDSDALVQLYAQATDPEARAVMTALADAAGALSGLKGSGEFDVRAAVADAAGMAVNAARKGLKLSDVLQNADLDMNPDAFVVAEFMAQNIRSSKRMAEGLRNMAQFALEQVRIARENLSQSGMFGPTPTASRQQIFGSLNNERTETSTITSGQQRFAEVAPESAAADARADGRGTPDRAGRGGQREASATKQVSGSASAPELSFSRTGDQTTTPEFKRWFGDSKVVDAEGKPLVVYHGTGAPSINVFDLSKAGQNGRSEGSGIYFTTDRAIAEGYGQSGTVVEAYVSITKPLDYSAKPFTQPQMRQLLADLATREAQNAGIEWKDGFLSNFTDTYNSSLQASVREAAKFFSGDKSAIDQLGGLVGAGVDAQTVNDALTATLGFDGYKSDGYSGAGNKGGTIWVAMRSEQVKSATGNNGNFDPQDPDIRHSFAGQRAATANPHALATAQQRLDAGEDAEGVRQDTGWHRGPDGKWRFEINDSDARLELTPAEFRTFASNGGSVRLGDLLEHPALFAAYPALRDMPVGMKMGAGASYSPTRNRVLMGGQVPAKSFLSVLLHEVQHGIQDIEGFATGGDPESPALMPYVRKIYAENIDNFYGESHELVKMAKRRVYQNLAGEVEARNTQARQGMTDAERRATAPGATADVADADVIVTFNGKEMANAPLPANGLAESAQPRDTPATKASVQAAVRELVNGMGMLPNRLGRVVVATAAEIKQEWEPLIGANSLEATDGAGDAMGFYDPRTKTVFLVADNIKAGEELGVVAHELMHKHGQAVLGDNGWTQLHTAIEGWATAAPGSKERQVYEAAAARVQSSRPVGSDAGVYSSQELFPYAVQVALDMGVKPNAMAKQGTVERWLAQVRAALREVFAKIMGNKADFNSQDLVNLAFGIAQRENPEHQSAVTLGRDATDAGFAAEVMAELGSMDDLYRWPVSDKTTLAGVFEDTYPAMREVGDATRMDEQKESGADQRTLFRNAAGRDFYVYEKGNQVWIDVSRFDPGQAGDAVYQAVANYAHNTGKVFVGDPAGLSPDAVERRTYHMLGSALRFGQTKHFQPAPEQLKGHPDRGIAPLKWQGNDGDKIKSLIESFTSSAFNRNPKLRDYGYDFNRKQFVGPDGAGVARSELAALVAEGDSDPMRRSRRAPGAVVFLDSLARQQSGQRPGLLAAALSRPAQLVDPLGGPLFSRRPDADAGVGDRVGATLKALTVTNLKQQTAFKATDLRPLGLQMLGRRQLVDVYGNMLPELKTYNDLMARMDADKNEAGAGADLLANEWSKLKDERQLAELMHDATLAQMDPARDFVDGDNRMQYGALRKRYDELTPAARDVYQRARDVYRQHMKDVRSAIKERIERAEMSSERRAAMLKRLDDEFFGHIKGVYFPLARFGQYVVVVKSADGKVENVSRAETMAEAETTRRQLLTAFRSANGFRVGKVLKSKDFVADRDTVGRGFMEQLYGVLDKQNMDGKQRAELEDALGQLYLSSLPDLSWAKHGIHRKGTAGFSQDARRAFAQHVFHGASYLAKLRYGDQLQDQLGEMQRRVDIGSGDAKFDSVRGQQVVDEMVKRHDAAMNPKTNALSTALTSLGFMFHLGLSPASAMVNLTQTALVAYPIMGSRWGFAKSSAALLKASAEATRGKNDITSSLSQDEKAAFDEAVRSGVIDVTMAHDLAGISQGEDRNVSYKLRPVMNAASFLFHHAEKFNRQVTFVAAYRLAREAGADAKKAYEQAVQATYDGHFDYSSNNRPRVMQGNAARVLLLFKQYGQNMVYTLARNAQQSLKGATPEARAEARKALGGLLVMHGMAAGALGLPMVTTLLAAASMLGSDDDEPWDAQVALQNMLADTFGQKPAEVMAHGLSRLTPWDISGRVGLDKLIFPDVQEGLEGQRLAESAMAAALGPVAGIGINALKGVQEMSHGRYALGLETMAPTVLRGPLKAWRYENEGVKDKTGIVVKDEVDAAALLGQAAGFSPSSVRNAYEGKSAIVGHDRALMARRSALVERFAMAAMAGDEQGKAEAREAVAKFNEKNPERRIQAMQLAQSVARRQKRIREAEDGVHLPSKRRGSLEQGRFAVES